MINKLFKVKTRAAALWYKLKETCHTSRRFKKKSIFATNF